MFVSIPGIVCDLVWGVWCLAGRGKGSRRYLHEFVIVLFYGGTYQSGPNMVCKNRGIYGVLSPSWVLITYKICPPCSVLRGYVVIRT